MSISDQYLQIKKAALRNSDGTPTDGLVHPGQSYHVDFPAEDKENLIMQVLHLKLPLTHEVCEQIGRFQKRYGLGTEATAQLILSFGVVQLVKFMDSPFVEPGTVE